MGLGLHKDDESERPHGQPPRGFRLIDVTRGCIVAAESLHEYVTLSYVWPPPGKRILKLLTSNKDELIERDGSLVDPLLPFASQIPQTIKDAMEICKEVAERYLWVDALCIIQDDDNDRDNQIRAMDNIYSASKLTLASTCGDNAEASISGARGGTRTIVQAIETVQGLRLANRPWNFARSVDGARWNTRAWTFQERVLSKRTLFLTPQQMFFKCRHSPSYLSEDLLMPAEARRLVTWPMNDTGSDFIPHHGSINVLTYIKTVENFTKRNLTYPDDILNAFTGIAQNMRVVFRSGFLYGLTQSELDYCLCWEPAGAIKRRICARGAKFPSWSWAGWLGPVHYRWKNRLSRVRWVHHETGERLTSDDYRSPSPGNGSETDGRLAWRQEWTDQRARSGFRYFYHSSDQAAWFRSPTAPELARLQGPNCVPGTQHLQFETEIIDFPMSEAWIPQGVVHETLQVMEFQLIDEHQDAVGFFSMPVKIAREISSTKKYKFVRVARVGNSHHSGEIGSRKEDPEPDTRGSYAEDHDIVFEDLDGDPDLILVRHTTMLLYPDERISPGGWKYPLPFDRQWYDASRPFCLCEFLVVEMVDDVAYRIGIGRAHVDAWAQTPPKTEVVTLG
ncbi:HET-domain-containing protein [Canariomyces notabilis]|uniref:HET-domain-containing protein n=1 Tax=Canariomyces notabilis TaxID=2074819 RepID=A0AAN6QK20_9PEZI|nr:HET-domain-containing protein [Canariomyces arenarius]